MSCSISTKQLIGGSIMDLEQKLEQARVRAEKTDAEKSISQQLQQEYAELEEKYGKEFAVIKREFDGLTTNEFYYDSFAEQMQRRDDYIKSCEAEIQRLQYETYERHLKSASWNLNRIASALETMVRRAK